MLPLAFLLLTAATAQGQVSVTTYRNDLARSGANTRETILTLEDVNPDRFGKIASWPLDGQVYAQPLYLPLVSIPGKGIHNVVFVATEHDSVYAFDGDSGPGAAPLWRVNFTDFTGEATVSAADVLGCNSILPELGITGTPVIDPATGTLYVVASTVRDGQFIHRLHALDITTGAERPGSPVVIEATVPGTGEGWSQQTVPFHPYLYKNRAGLLLLNGIVYTAWASNCDWGPYHGWLIGYSAAGLRQVAVFNVSPNSGQSSIWMGGAAPAADSAGNIYAITGNGPFDADSNGADFGDTFLKLSTANGLAVADYFTPFNQASLNTTDTDLGSSGPLLLPDSAGSPAHPHLLVGGGKEGRVYLLDRDRMGGFNPTGDGQIVQSITGAVGSLYGGAAYFNSTLFFAGKQDSLKAFAILDGRVANSPTSQSSEVFGEEGAAPTVSANGSANGIVWLVEPSFNGTLHAYDAANLAHELYHSQMNPARDAPGSYVRFSVPIVANGKVYVGTGNSVAIFGLFDAPRQPRLVTLVNAASLHPGPVAPGSLISIFGSDLLPGRVSLSINGIRCPLLFTSPTQINAQVPFDAAPGPAIALLQSPRTPPSAISLTVAPAAPGIFTIDSTGATVQNDDGSINTAANPAPAESTVSVYLTGQGSVTPALATGSPAPVSPKVQAVYPVAAVIGGLPAEVTSSELTPGVIGVFRVTLRLPRIKTGDYQAIVRVNGLSSNSVPIHIAGAHPMASAAPK